MSNLKRGGMSTSATRLEALDIQSSSYAVPIALFAGVTRLPGNLIYYNDFKSKPVKSSSGKGGGSVTTGYDYSASMILALGKGHVSLVPRIWVGNKLYSDASSSNAKNKLTSESFAVPAAGGYYTVTNQASFASNYKVTTTRTTSDGKTSTITLAEGVDYIQQNGSYTFPANSAAVGKTVSIAYSYKFSSSPTPALQQLNLTLMPGSIPQSPPSWVTNNHPSDAMGYAGLACVTGQNYDIGTGGTVPNHNFEVVGPGAYSISDSTPDVDPSWFTLNVLKDSGGGCNVPSSMLGDSSDWSSYCIANNILMSPALTTQQPGSEFLKQMGVLTNTGFVWSSGVLKFIPYADVPVTGNGITYTPNTVPAYDLTDDVFITEGAEPPVKVTRKKVSDTFNRVQVQFRNRSNSYAREIAEAKDQTDIDLNGMRAMDVVVADWICDATVARNVAQLILQRALYVRCTYEFSLPWNFYFLEPMDLVTLEDSTSGLVATPVRITKVEESDDGFKFTAEDWPLGVASAPLYTTQVGAGFMHDFNVSPGSVSAPVIFEAPPALTTTGLEVYVAVAGTGANWGGCHVWVSADGNSYSQVDTVNGPSRYGSLSAPCTASTLSVGVVEGQLAGGSAADAAALNTLCFIGGQSPEFVAYTTAALTGTQAYNLTLTQRGLYGTSQAIHEQGAPFVRMDDTMGTSGPLDLSMVGKTIYLKFTSFNLYGGGEEDISTVPAYPYTITGNIALAAPDDLQEFALHLKPGALVFEWDASSDIGDETELHNEAAWSNATTPIYRGTATSYILPWPADGTYTILAKRRRAKYGTYSTNARGITFTIAGSTIGNVSAQWYSSDGTPGNWNTSTGQPAEWGSLENVAFSIDTGQITETAATEVVTASRTTASTVTCNGYTLTPSSGYAAGMPTVSYTNPCDHPIVLEVTAPLTLRWWMNDASSMNFSPAMAVVASSTTSGFTPSLSGCNVNWIDTPPGVGQTLYANPVLSGRMTLPAGANVTLALTCGMNLIALDSGGISGTVSYDTATLTMTAIKK